MSIIEVFCSLVVKIWLFSENEKLMHRASIARRQRNYQEDEQEETNGSIYCSTPTKITSPHDISRMNIITYSLTDPPHHQSVSLSCHTRSCCLSLRIVPVLIHDRGINT